MPSTKNADFAEEFDRTVSDQIARCERAVSVSRAIREYWGSTGDVKFNKLLTHLDFTQGESAILALGRLFDPPSSRYPTRSIPALLASLEASGLEPDPKHRAVIVKFLEAHDPPDGDLSNASGAKLTNMFVERFRARLEGCWGASEDVVQSLDRIKKHRNKRVAHNEAWCPGANEMVAWGDIEALLSLAKLFASIVGPAYAGLSVVASEGEHMGAGSRMLGRSMERFITMAVRNLR